MKARFSGRCASCGGVINKGDEIHYEPKTRSAWHQGCFADDLTQQDFDASFQETDEEKAERLGFKHHRF